MFSPLMQHCIPLLLLLGWLTLTSATVSINSEGKASIAFIESSDLDAPILKGELNPQDLNSVMTWEVVAVEGSRVLMNVTDLLRDENTFIRFTSTLGAVSKYSLNGVVGDSFNITAPTAGLYNVQACINRLCGPALLLELKEIPYIIERAETATVPPVGLPEFPSITWPSGSFSIEMWGLISASSPTGSYFAFMGTAVDGLTSAKSYHSILQFYRFSSTTVKTNVYFNGVGYHTDVALSPVLGDWNSWIVSFDSTTSTFSSYLNGVLAGTKTSVTPPTPGNVEFVPLTHFKDNVSPLQVYESNKGLYPGEKMASIRMYNKAFSAGEIVTLHSKGVSVEVGEASYLTLQSPYSSNIHYEFKPSADEGSYSDDVLFTTL